MNQETKDDLSFVREMTEAGRDAPLLGGRFFVFYGALLPIIYAAQWMILDGRFGFPQSSIAFVWIAFGVIVTIAKPMLIASLKRKPGRGALGNRVESVVWTVSGFTIFSAFVGALFGSVVMGQSFIVWDFILAAAFGAYGIALYTTGEISSAHWLKPYAIVAIAGAGVVPVLAGRPEVYLFAAAIIIAISLVPGLRLMANEPKSLPEEA